MPNDKVWCICRRCGAEMCIDLNATCPVCGNQPLEKSWSEHVSIEDEYVDGRHLVVIRKSADPIAGHYCSPHQRRE